MVATPRLGLGLPVGASDLISTGDNVLSDSYQKIDDAMGAKTATTVAAVAAGMVFKGSCAYETTNLEAKHYSGSAWKYTGSDSSARGNQAKLSDTTQKQTSTELKVGDCVFTAKTGRKYWCEYQAFLKLSEDIYGEGEIRIRWAQAASTSVSSTLLETQRYWVLSFADLGSSFLHGLEFFPDVNAQVAIGVYIKAIDAQLISSIGSVELVWDVRDWGV